MPLLSRCCFCFSLKTGSVILGWLGFVISVLDMAGIAGVLANLNTLINEEQEPETYTKMRLSLPYMLASTLLGAVSYLLLLIGASRGNRFFLLPWLVMGLMSIVGSTFLVIIVSSVFLNSEEYASVGLLIMMFGFTVIAVTLYWWLCVYSLFQQLRENAGVVYRPPPVQTEYTGANTPPPPYKSLESV